MDEYNLPNQVATQKETDRKCPDCGGVMDFDPGTGGLACPYCGHTEAIPAAAAGDGQAAAAAQELDFESAEQTANQDWGAEKKMVICKSCGAESIYDALQIANECPYCGSNQVMEAQDKNTMAPGGVCVFKVDSKKAGELFMAWIKKKWFCPKVAKEKAKPESFQGVYLPFWTFDAQTNSRYSGRYGKYRTERDSEGNTHTETDWYPVSGRYDEFIDDQIVAASTQHDTDYLSGLEPFNTADNLTYKPEYVAGFVAERYSVGLKDGWEKAKKLIFGRVKRNISTKVERENFADVVEIDRLSISYSAITFKYLLLPVWMSSFKFKDKQYHFMVNGQTGKVSGSTPISALRVAIAILIALVAIFVIYYMVSG